MKYILVFFTFFYVSCSEGKKKDLFYIPEMQKLEQQPIQDIGKRFPIYFSQYEGFYFKSADSSLNRIFIVIDDQSLIEANEINKAKQEELKKKSAIGLLIKYKFYTTPSKLEIEFVVKKYFSQFRINGKGSSFDIIDKCNNHIAKIVYNDFAIPNLLIRIYPTHDNCF